MRPFEGVLKELLNKNTQCYYYFCVDKEQKLQMHKVSHKPLMKYICVSAHNQYIK